MSKAKRIAAKRRHDRLQVRKEQELAERAQEMDARDEDELDVQAILPTDEWQHGAMATPEDLNKMYDEPMGEMGMMQMGPTSFEELEAQRDAMERAHEVQEVTWDVQDLVRNILHNPMIEPVDKSAKIKAVADEFEERLAEAMMDAEDMEKDLDVLQIEAILATDARHTGPLEKVGDLIKAKLSAAARKKLSDSDFALPSKKKYPIHDKAHVRNALARAAQQMKGGGEGAADAKAAMPKIRAAAKRMGIEMGMEKSAILIEKDAKGDWRWIGRPTNNFIDWQTDIISKSAHQNYVAWLDENPELAPVFLSWHTPGTARENPVDFWMEQDGAVIMSGVLTNNEAAALFKAQTKTDLGMSFQGLGMRLDTSDPRVVSHYWMYEVSDLPLDKAANPFTELTTMIKEVGMDKLEYLTTIMGSEAKAKAYLEKTGQMQKQLAEAGITSKEKEETTPPPEPEKAETPAAVPVDVKAILEQVAKELDVEGLNAFVAQAQESLAKVEILEELVKSLQSSSEDKLAEMLEPPAARFAWSKAARPTERETTKLQKDAEEDEKLGKAVPGVPDDYWLNKVTNTVPVSIETS
jgi:hypothetical protein